MEIDQRCFPCARQIEMAVAVTRQKRLRRPLRQRVMVAIENGDGRRGHGVSKQPSAAAPAPPRSLIRQAQLKRRQREGPPFRNGTQQLAESLDHHAPGPFIFERPATPVWPKESRG
jgi:hypothetical protein